MPSKNPPLKADTERIYGLEPTSERVAKLLLTGRTGECRRHIETKKRQIRQRRQALGIEGGGQRDTLGRVALQTVPTDELAGAWREMQR